MLLFRSEEQIDSWCKKNDLKHGESLSIQKVWELSQLWYHNRLNLDFHGRNVDRVLEIFTQAGLTSRFWQDAK